MSFLRRIWPALPLLALNLWPAETPENIDLQALLDKAPPSSEVMIPKGVWRRPLTVSKPLLLRGEEGSILSVTADQPALRIKSRDRVLIESLTVQWRRETSGRVAEPPCAILAVDSAVVLRKVRVQSGGSHAEAPAGIMALGFSEMAIEQCSTEGFDFAVQFADGAKGRIMDSLVWKPGHAGITVGPNSALEVAGSIITGSGYHGVRCTGGSLNASNNLIVENKNRGVYLGNKDAAGVLRNNLIVGNTTGISGFAQSEVEIVHNMIAESDYAGLDMRDSCRLQVHHNIFVDNTRALVLFNESGRNRNLIGPNLLWGNKTDSEGFEPVPELARQDPQLKDPRRGEFSLADLKMAEEYGLRNPQALKALWARWTAWREGQSTAGAAGKP